ncbi:MAG TPA: hypothetical protein VE486_04835 [Candidatus Baltobacteraceae bacterium]|nr:hypothetical protein [Candidatus Baltobacteraceae bacterium]
MASELNLPSGNGKRLRPLPVPRIQKLTIIAQDPGVRDENGCILRAAVELPAETLQPGPWGYRVHVIDYDAATSQLWKPYVYRMKNGILIDPFAKKSDAQLLSDPRFHQQNVYAIIMRILARFEHALGRRVSWSFGGHQLKVAPHASCDANAFYSKQDEGLLLGYFVDPSFKGKRPTAGNGLVFSCLSHDVIAHETTHALVDGLRRHYTDPSSPDQAAFHEGISDIVALLSVFALEEVMSGLLSNLKDKKIVHERELTPERLRKSALFGLAEEMGSALAQVRGEALRRSVNLEPSAKWLRDPEFQEPHRRGEILVAAILNALIDIWAKRLDGLRRTAEGKASLSRVVEEGRRVADTLLTMTIRALDYSPPVHLDFGDYLSALLTADREIRPDDSVYRFRNALVESFARYGIKPSSPYGGNETGVWGSPEEETNQQLSYARSHFEPMQRDADEVFRFIWENREALDLYEGVYTQVQSVRPCVRIDEDGFTLRETVAEYVQILRLMPAELTKAGYTQPDLAFLPDDREVALYGGGTLIFDEWGRLKYHIHNRLKDTKRQSERLQYLAEAGYYLLRRPQTEAVRIGGQGHFARLHLNRGLNRSRKITEGWVTGIAPAPGQRSHLHEETIAEESEPIEDAID